MEKYQVIIQQEKLQLFCKVSAEASHVPYWQGGNNLYVSEKRKKRNSLYIVQD